MKKWRKNNKRAFYLDVCDSLFIKVFIFFFYRRNPRDVVKGVIGFALFTLGRRRDENVPGSPAQMSFAPRRQHRHSPLSRYIPNSTDSVIHFQGKIWRSRHRLRNLSANESVERNAAALWQEPSLSPSTLYFILLSKRGGRRRHYLHRGNHERGNDKPNLNATAPANEENAAVPRRTSLKRRTRGNKNKDYRRARYSVKDNKIRSNALARQPRSLRDKREERGKTITIAYSRGMSRRSLPASRRVRKLFPNMSAAARAAWWNTSCS